MKLITSLMEKATDVVQVGQQSMLQTSQGIDVLEQNVLNVSARMEEIAGILADQAKASQEVSEGVVRIAEASERNVQSLGNLSKNMSVVEEQVLDQVAQFMEHDIPHKVIRVAKSDHIIWKKRIADIMAGKANVSTKDLSDHTSCRLGQFYYKEGKALYGHLDAFKQIEAPHAEVHKWGLQAIEHYNRNEKDEALRAVAKMEQASDQVILGLDTLLAQVAE